MLFVVESIVVVVVVDKTQEGCMSENKRKKRTGECDPDGEEEGSEEGEPHALPARVCGRHCWV